ncbi:MAG: vWA domain-containing protein, partial [bacterium]
MIEISGRAAAELAACILTAGAAAYLLYRRTTPATPRGLRLALGIGRYVAMLLVLLLAVDPVIWVKRTESSEPVVLVMVDDSGSMAHPSLSAKLDTVKAALSSGLIDALESRAAVRAFTFSDRVAEVSLVELGNLSPRGSRTDLVSGLEFALDRLDGQPAEIVIVSDGGVNFGKDAQHFCAGLRVPVHTVSVAEVTPTPDLSIDRLEFGEMAYAGSVVPLEIYLSGRNEAPVETRISVRDSTGTVYEEAVTVPGSGARLKRTARVSAGETGIHRFTVSLDPFEGEEVVRNNGKTFSLRVIKGRIRVCVVAPGPSWDFAFTRRNLIYDPNVEVYAHFTSPGAKPVDIPDLIDDLGARLPELDAVVAMGGVSFEGLAQHLTRFVSGGGGLLLLSAGGRAASLGNLNPIATTGTAPPRQSVSVTAVVTETGMEHEIMNIGGTFRADIWADL